MEENISVTEEFLTSIRDNGMEQLAKDSGLIQNGTLTSLTDYYANNQLPTQILGSLSPNGVTPQKSSGSNMITRKKKSAPLIQEDSPEDNPNKKRKRATNNTTAKATSSASDKANKGLRHFSLKVCQKVEQKKVTTYNEVADELVTEFTSDVQVDQKNIRRRVYDALNVLMAMNIIQKDKKEIRWIGLPTNAKQDLEILESEKNERIERLIKKKGNLEELLSQQASYKALIDRNSKPDYANIETKINLPFIIVNTRSSTVIECEVADDRSAYFFNFSLPFEIHDDSEILKRILVSLPHSSQVTSTSTSTTTTTTTTSTTVPPPSNTTNTTTTTSSASSNYTICNNNNDLLDINSENNNNNNNGTNEHSNIVDNIIEDTT